MGQPLVGAARGQSFRFDDYSVNLILVTAVDNSMIPHATLSPKVFPTDPGRLRGFAERDHENRPLSLQLVAFVAYEPSTIVDNPTSSTDGRLSNALLALGLANTRTPCGVEKNTCHRNLKSYSQSEVILADEHNRTQLATTRRRTQHRHTEV